MELTLGVRVSSRRLFVVEDKEGLLRESLLDCTSATLVGLVGRALRAAAAAAEEREASEARRINAEAAAVAALALAVSLVKGCGGERTRYMVSDLQYICKGKNMTGGRDLEEAAYHRGRLSRSRCSKKLKFQARCWQRHGTYLHWGSMFATTKHGKQFMAEALIDSRQGGHQWDRKGRSMSLQ